MPDLEEALERIDDTWTRVPYEAVLAALDECARHPQADSVMPGIWQRRVHALRAYDRPDEERIEVLNEFLALGYPLRARGGSVVVACVGRPDLTKRYLLPIIAELEAAAGDDRELNNMLASLRIARDRTLGPTAP